jgi:hypothetical protein
MRFKTVFVVFTLVAITTLVSLLWQMTLAAYTTNSQPSIVRDEMKNARVADFPNSILANAEGAFYTVAWFHTHPPIEHVKPRRGEPTP